jgi:hypothetical protein
MRVTELYCGEVYDDGENHVAVLDIYEGETTLFITGPDAYRVMRGPNRKMVNLVHAIMSTADDYESQDEYDEAQRVYWMSEHEGVRIVSARPGDVDFDPHADYCNHDTEYMLDCETGELYDL